MPDIFYLISKWWKQMLFVVLLAVVVAGVIVFLQPNEYLSVATSLPANSLAADKARIFNKNIESLYPGFGSPDDLDRIIGTARLDTVYFSVTDQFNLFDHYKISGENEKARIKAACILKKHTRVIKSDYGELKVKVWDTDKNLAPQLANAIMEELEIIHRHLQGITNKTSYESLQLSQQRLQKEIDSLDHHLLETENKNSLSAVRRQVLFDQWQENEKLISEYQLMLENNPPVLMTVEKARPANRPDKPKRLEITIATGLLGLLFAFLSALAIEQRKK